MLVSAAATAAIKTPSVRALIADDDSEKVCLGVVE